MIHPGSAEATVPVLEESLRIKEALLPARNVVSRVHAAVENITIEQAAASLGYPEVNAAEDKDMLDKRSAKTLMITPRMLSHSKILPLLPNSVRTTRQARHDLSEMQSLRDHRLSVGMGYCSVRDPEEVLEYTDLMLGWQKLFPHLQLMERIFSQKPRTPIPYKNGKNTTPQEKNESEHPWKGFMYDPYVDRTYDINLGVIAVRMLMSRVTDKGMPIIQEQLDVLSPQFFDGLVAQNNIGARTVSAPYGMELIAGSSAHGAFKNDLLGNIRSAAQAAAAARHEQSFIGIDSYGNICLVQGRGNETSHIVLRGGDSGPNYTAESVEEAKSLAAEYGIPLSIDIDASHGNSGKKAINQLTVVKNVGHQVAEGERYITNLQLETALVGGRQDYIPGKPKDKLVRGQSTTDECAGPDQTQEMLDVLNESAAKRYEQNHDFYLK
jgi:3-deoxy-7-phosphoheptulonate synthase